MMHRSGWRIAWITGSLAAAIFAIGPAAVFAGEQRKSPHLGVALGNPVVKIVQDHLIDTGDFYVVKGTVFNPNDRAVSNVHIRYYIWKKWLGRDGHGMSIKETGGLVSATIKYLPPRQSADFVASGDDSAPVMTPESGLLPDPIEAEITATWG